MLLKDYLDTDKLRAHVFANGLVSARRHNTLPLTIYCYTRKTVTNQVWDDVTTKTRGLIVDDDGKIVARPYEKFFSLDQHPHGYDRFDIKAIDDLYGPPTITEKVNGALGIFWRYGIHWGVASKGSFHSPHAEFATKWMEQHIEEHGPLVFPEGYTPVFEIICQEVQPHVIKYPKDGLVLLNFVNIETGEELSRLDTVNYSYIGHLRITPLTLLPFSEVLGSDSERIEGYVATYTLPGRAPFKLKIKFPTFLKNRKAFYAEQKLKQEPENMAVFLSISERAKSIVKAALVECTEQKEFAAFFQKPENVFYAPACFAMLNYEEDKEKHKRAIWRLVEKYDNTRAEGSTEASPVG